MGVQATTIKISSVALRLSALIFFRVFPAHFPSITFALFAIYAPTFLVTYFLKPELEVVDDKVDIAVKETLIEPESADEPSNGVVAEEIDVREETTLAEKAQTPWEILVYGSPDTRQPIWSAVSFLINGLLVLLTADALYRARLLHPSHDLSFVRLGYVSHSEAKFLLREPDQSKMPITVEVRVADPHSPFDSGNAIWQVAGGLKSTSEATDFTGVVNVPLKSSQQRWYDWRTSNNHTGQFLSAPRPGNMPEYNGGKFTFLSTSCILPRFPYNPLDHALAIPGMRHLANRLPHLGAQFMLFLGDFIYVDVPQRFGKSVEEYRMQYRQVYASPEWQPVGQNLSWIHVLDDHEISNDWSSQDSGIYETAVEPWNIYQANVNPPQAIKAGTSSLRRKDATWYEFTQGPASFFMLDTRSYRSSNNEPFKDEEKTMLGPEQLADFLAWLARPEPRGVKWKIIASSVPFTKNWPVNVKDTWGGFLVERQKILEAMWDTGARGMGVVILSGDRHEFAATKFPPPAGSKWPTYAAPHEISASPLNQFASPIPTYKQTDDEDVKLKYISSGSSKFGSFTIENVDGESQLSYQLYVDGKPRWNTTFYASPKGGERPAGSFWGRFKFLN